MFLYSIARNKKNKQKLRKYLEISNYKMTCTVCNKERKRRERDRSSVFENVVIIIFCLKIDYNNIFFIFLKLFLALILQNDPKK